eukprot:2949149-Prymnesium_polylepis.1
MPVKVLGLLAIATGARAGHGSAASPPPTPAIPSSSVITLGLGVAQDVFGITYKLRTVVFTAERAVSEINADPSMLHGYELQLLHKETACSQSAGFTAAIEAHAYGITGFIGATCSGVCQMVATVGK